MANVHNFTFDTMSRIGNDLCGISEKDLQNQKVGSYLTYNHFEKDSCMGKPIHFATSQPNVYYNGGAGVSAGHFLFGGRADPHLGNVQGDC